MSKDKLSVVEIDAIGEILNISLGASATAVSTMLDTRVDITTPVVRVRTEEEFEFRNLEPAVCVQIKYVEGLSGENIMLLKKDDVRRIVEKLMRTELPEDEFELNEMYVSAICEVMNQMMGASATALSELLSKSVNISTPTSFEVEDVTEFKKHYFKDGEPMVDVSFDLKIGDNAESEFMNLMPINLAKNLVASFFPDNFSDDEEDEQEVAQIESESEDTGSSGTLSQAEIEALMAKETEPEPENTAEGSSGGTLSQEEIEALMNKEAAPEPENAAEGSSGGTLSQEEIEALMNKEQVQSEAPVGQQTQEPGMMNQQPGMMNQQPGMMNQQPGMMNQQPGMMNQQPGMMNQQPMQPAQSSQTEAMMKQMMDMMQQQMQQQNQQMQNLQNQINNKPQEIKVNPVSTPNLNPEGVESKPDANMDLIMGVSLDVSVEIGRTKKLVKDILELSKGSLVVLDKLAGDQVDIFANGECIAKGDVVVVEDNFAVRITEILQDEIKVVE